MSVLPPRWRWNKRNKARTFTRNRTLSAEPLEPRRVLSAVTFSTSESQFDPGVDNQGWWSDVWPSKDSNENYYTGFLKAQPDKPVRTMRSFFTFDLTSLDLSDEEIVSATLRLTRFTSYSPDGSETIEFFDVSTPADVLNENVGMNSEIYEDLGTGASYGRFEVAVDPDPQISLDVLSFDLNSEALADIAALANNATSGTKYFSIGGAVTSIGQDVVNEGLFGFSQNNDGVQQLVITTRPPNAAPVAADDSYVVDEDHELIVASPGVLLNDSDPDGDALTVIAHTQPIDGEGNSAGAVVVDDDGSFTYTPEANFYGAVTFEYTISDGRGGTDTGVVAITVNPVADAVSNSKPGNGNAPTNLQSNGILSVVIYSGGIDSLDATKIDLDSIRLNDREVRLRNAAFEDIDGDGLDDLLLHFDMKSVREQGVLDPTVPEDQVLTITGQVDDGGLRTDLLAEMTIHPLVTKGKKSK